jgi:hypothetical protein
MVYFDRVLAIDPKDVAALDDKGLLINLETTLGLYYIMTKLWQ